jgi:hypothetical protein
LDEIGIPFRVHVTVGVGAPDTLTKNSTFSPALTSIDFDLSIIFGERCSPVISNLTSREISDKIFLTTHLTVPQSLSVILLIRRTTKPRSSVMDILPVELTSFPLRNH